MGHGEPASPSARGLQPGPRSPPCFPRGFRVRVRILAGTWEGRSPAQEERSWAPNLQPHRSPASGRAACQRRSPQRGLRPRGGGEGLGAGRRSRRQDWNLLALPAGLPRRVASPGRGGRSVGRPAGREWLWGSPGQRWACKAALGAPPGTCVFLVCRARGAHLAHGTNKNPAGVYAPFPAPASACGAPGGPSDRVEAGPAAPRGWARREGAFGNGRPFSPGSFTSPQRPCVLPRPAAASRTRPNSWETV